MFEKKNYDLRLIQLLLNKNLKKIKKTKLKKSKKTNKFLIKYFFIFL